MRKQTALLGVMDENISRIDLLVLEFAKRAPLVNDGIDIRFLYRKDLSNSVLLFRKPGFQNYMLLVFHHGKERTPLDPHDIDQFGDHEVEDFLQFDPFPSAQF